MAAYLAVVLSYHFRVGMKTKPRVACKCSSFDGQIVVEEICRVVGEDIVETCDQAKGKARSND